MHVQNVVRQSTAAAQLGVTKQRVRELIQIGKLKTVEVDGVPHVTLKSLDTLKKIRAAKKASA